MVLDELARRRSNGAESCDRDGRLAAAGTVDAALLAELLAAPALAAPPPRSFGQRAVRCRLLRRPAGAREPPGDERAWCDLFATVTELTVQAVAMAYRRFVLPVAGRVRGRGRAAAARAIAR